MIEDAHRNFARALVALAREHGMDSLSVTYRLGFPRRSEGPFVPWNSDQVQLSWAAGRHGIAAPISLQSVERDRLDETEAA